MLPRCGLGIAGLLAVALAGCESASVARVMEYADVSPAVVGVGCLGQAYEVYDRSKAGTLLVASTPGQEAIVGLCPDGSPAQRRFRSAAEAYLEREKRGCTVTSEVAVTAVHSEFRYRC
jgi:hypothetical protein